MVDPAGLFVPSPGYDVGRLNGSVLLLPAVSVGNVGQLALDLLVSTLGMRRVGFIDDPCVLPVAGADAFEREAPASSGCLTTNLEVFQTADSLLTILQQRAPPAKSFGGRFVRNILNWVRLAGFREVLVLASADAARRVDSQMNARFRSVAGPASASRSWLLARFRDELGVRDMEEIPNEEEALADKIRQEEGRAASQTAPEAEEVRFAMRTLPAMPGSGLTRLLIATSERMIEKGELEVPTVALVTFASEGDNVPDAVLVADLVLQALKSPPHEAHRKWKFPASWKNLFGRVDRTGQVEMYQ